MENYEKANLNPPYYRRIYFAHTVCSLCLSIKTEASEQISAIFLIDLLIA